MDPLMLALRLLHILAGLFWTGAALMMTFFLYPAVRASGPAGGAVMQQLMHVRRLPFYLSIAGTLTVLSGGGMMWHNGAVSGGAWFRTSTAHTLMLGATLAIIAAIIGSTLSKNTAIRIAALASQMQHAGGPPSPTQIAEMGALQLRLSRAMHSVAGLLVLAAAAMAVARYT